jgi:hypothetical protein
MLPPADCELVERPGVGLEALPRKWKLHLIVVVGRGTRHHSRLLELSEDPETRLDEKRDRRCGDRAACTQSRADGRGGVSDDSERQEKRKPTRNARGEQFESRFAQQVLAG